MPDITSPEFNQKKEAALINIQWQALEFEKYEKGISWFIIVGFIGLIIFTIALLTKNFIFAAMIILTVLAIFIYALKEPKLVNFKIDGRGLSVDEKFYAYSELDSFWIFYDPPLTKELSIKSKRWSSPLIKIPLHNQDPTAIREALMTFIPEEEQQQSLTDNIAKHLRF